MSELVSDSPARVLSSDPPPPTLEVRGLSVTYRVAGRRVAAARDVDFTVPAGETVALVGESGSGKSTVANAVLRLLPGRNNTRVGGEVRIGGRSVLGLSEQTFRTLRIGGLGYVPQDPTSSLNPVRRISPQVREALTVTPQWRRAGERELHDECLRLLTVVGLPDPERVLQLYPHELSGGMLQRVLVAIAISQRPRLIVADEPTSALDVSVQRVVLDLLVELQAELGLSLLLITHDLAVARELAAEVVVLRGGRVVERGRTAELFARPTDPYTRELLSNIPALTPDRYAAARAGRRPVAEDGPSALAVEGIRKTFDGRGHSVQAVRGVSFSAAPGTTHALVGESGSGKTTVARMILRLEEPTAGRITVAGRDVGPLAGAALREYRREVALVYQNPYLSLNPRHRVGAIVAEPLVRFRVGDRRSRGARVDQLLEEVGLPRDSASAHPGELSGGQRQRVAIARALALRPTLLVLDEATSALDVTVQGQILDVLVRLQDEHQLTYLVISHDFGVVRQIADTITVLKDGEVVEDGPTARVFARPRADYTRRLIDAVPGVAGITGTTTLPPTSRQERA